MKLTSSSLLGVVSKVYQSPCTFDCTHDLPCLWTVKRAAIGYVKTKFGFLFAAAATAVWCNVPNHCTPCVISDLLCCLFLAVLLYANLPSLRYAPLTPTCPNGLQACSRPGAAIPVLGLVVVALEMTQMNSRARDQGLH